MTLDTLIILSGALVAVLPYLGFPSSWDKVLFLILGIFILGLGIALRRRGSEKETEKQQNEVFGEPFGSEHDTH